ncbi:MAG: hypothetical protein LBL48_11935 [Azoarcus sp.]|jgi:hypothetical protein|nr:hypothetical protein [Azoarcus sp.]
MDTPAGRACRFSGNNLLRALRCRHILAFLSSIAAALPFASALAQETPSGQDGAAALAEPDQPAKPSGEDERDTSGYRFPALAVTVAAAQNMAYAMILRDYCANARLPAAFVRERLARFSRMTGREESCPSLLDY